jgi:hypothetical protein
LRTLSLLSASMSRSASPSSGANAATYTSPRTLPARCARS